MDTKRLFKIPEAYQYLEAAISIDALYAIAKSNLIPVVRCGGGAFLFPRSSLDRLATGEVDLSAIVSRRQIKRTRR